MQVRASTKFIKVGYLLCILVVAIAIAAVLKTMGPFDDRLWWLEIVPAFLMIILITRHLKRLLVKLEITSDHVRYESGLFSKMTRTEDVTKLQDVQVHQTLGQRMMGIGDLSFETAGASSPIVMHSIDQAAGRGGIIFCRWRRRSGCGRMRARGRRTERCSIWGPGFLGTCGQFPRTSADALVGLPLGAPIQSRTRGSGADEGVRPTSRLSLEPVAAHPHP